MLRRDEKVVEYQMNSRVEIGRCTYGVEQLNLRVFGDSNSNLTIGSFCSISSDIHIFLGGNHRTDWISTYPFRQFFPQELGETVPWHSYSNGDVVIGNDVWIGHGVSIMSGLTIGDGAVLAANAVVVKDVEPYDIVGGNPAKLIRKRFDDEIVDLLLALRWWDLPLETITSIARDLSAPPSRALLLRLLERYRPELKIGA